MSFDNVVLATDLSELSLTGVKAAFDFAGIVGSKKMHVVHVAELPFQRRSLGRSAIPKSLLESVAVELEATAQKRIDELDLPESPVEVVRSVVFGRGAQELSAYADRVRADVVVVTTRGLSGFERFVLGSFTSSLIRTVHCPVLVIREGRSLSPKFAQVIAAVDTSDVVSAVLDHAVSLAQSTVHALAVLEVPMLAQVGPDSTWSNAIAQPFRDAMEELVPRDRYPTVELEIEATKHRPSDAILEVTAERQPDLLVLGTSGHNTWHRMLLGSTATRVLHEASCPVLIVPFVPSPED